LRKRLLFFYDFSMKTKRIILLVSLILILSTALGAADYDTYKNAIGAQAGDLSGYGLSFHNRLNSTSALQTTIGLMYEGQPGSSSYLDYMLGLEYQHTFFADTYADWFAAHLYWFVGLNHSASMGWDGFSLASSPYTPAFGIGGGFGVEPIFLGHFSIPVSFGYGVFYKPTAQNNFDKFKINFIPQIGIRYRY